MQITLQQLVQECFDGDRERDCDSCPAHYSKNGICCFGYRFEDHDSVCQSCPHVQDCSILTYELNYEQEGYMQDPPRRRVTINRPSSSSYSYGSGYSPNTQRTVQVGQPTLKREGNLLANQQQRPQQKPVVQDKEIPFFKNLGLHAVWGAVEGCLEMMLGFFRGRRPD